MHRDTQIRTIFGVSRQKRGSSFYHWDAVWDWRTRGYPGVFSAFFFLTARGQQRWLRERTILFPDACCACGAPASKRIDFRPYRRLPFFRVRSSEPTALGIPHCNEHGGQDPAAFLEVTNEGEPFAGIRVFGRDRPFLEQCLELNRSDGDLIPPWKTFPNAVPYLGWNQGTNEYWKVLAWAPFWESLEMVERQRYVDQWQAPPEWRTHLLELPAAGTSRV